MPEFDINQAKQKFVELIDKILNSGEVIITRGGQPVAKLVAITDDKCRREYESAEGIFEISEDYDQLIKDFKEFM